MNHKEMYNIFLQVSLSYFISLKKYNKTGLFLRAIYFNIKCIYLFI